VRLNAYRRGLTPKVGSSTLCGIRDSAFRFPRYMQLLLTFLYIYYNSMPHALRCQVMVALYNDSQPADYLAFPE